MNGIPAGNTATKSFAQKRYVLFRPLKNVGTWRGFFEPSTATIFHGARACLKRTYRF